ncbi:hypothetical protein FR932_02580 [Moritella marina ATCC 15381]|uniref:Response regulator n=1 Tax=Moritella marina ATCC 15381 TaxID=1202962 RepID=A0A5J6WFV4_MORMI|nr:hypothetical protein [Moritella marina]QFI36796.1 hypothetical protein FR932_02580 [Moritella marina ATCC 15381]
MSKKALKVTPLIYSVLINDELDHFTVSQMRDAYLAKVCSGIDQNEARKIVYRQILRLQKLGMLSKQTSDNVKEHCYNKTELFYQVGLRTNRANSKNDEKANNPLEERLRRCEVDLLTSIAESEEYMRLYESLPELKEHLECQYTKSRECSSKLLGQIKAIKSVMLHQSKNHL